MEDNRYVNVIWKNQQMGGKSGKAVTTPDGGEQTEMADINHCHLSIKISTNTFSFIPKRLYRFSSLPMALSLASRNKNPNGNPN